MCVLNASTGLHSTVPLNAALRLFERIVPSAEGVQLQRVVVAAGSVAAAHSSGTM